MQTYDYIVLGCGVAGLCAARMLVDKGADNLLVLDQYSAPGGNQISKEINGYTFDIGAFYYWPTMPLFQMFPKLQEICLRTPIKVERIRPAGLVSEYPFSFRDEFLARGPLYWVKALSSILLGRLRQRPIVTAEDYAIHWMGRRLYADLGMRDYIERFFGLPAHQIESQFAEHRMQALASIGRMTYWTTRAARFLRSITRIAPHSPPEVLLVRPERGMDFMYGTIVDAMRECNVTFRLGEPLHGISKQGDVFEIHASSGTVRTRRLISTMPVRQMSEYFDIAAGRDLDCVDLQTIFLSFDGERGFNANILYNWGQSGRWKRLTMHSDYYGLRNGRQYANIEFPMFRKREARPEDLFSDFAASARDCGLFRGDLRLEGHMRVEKAYPANTLGASAKAAAAIAALKQLGVQAVGRQGRFDYLPTGEQVVRQVAQNLRA